MDENTPQVMGRSFPSVSPYLMRPLRSHAEALADIAAAKSRANTVTPFLSPVVFSGAIPRPRIVSRSHRAA